MDIAFWKRDIEVGNGSGNTTTLPPIPIRERECDVSYGFPVSLEQWKSKDIWAGDIAFWLSDADGSFAFLSGERAARGKGPWHGTRHHCGFAIWESVAWVGVGPTVSLIGSMRLGLGNLFINNIILMKNCKSRSWSAKIASLITCWTAVVWQGYESL